MQCDTVWKNIEGEGKKSAPPLLGLDVSLAVAKHTLDVHVPVVQVKVVVHMYMYSVLRVGIYV